MARIQVPGRITYRGVSAVVFGIFWVAIIFKFGGMSSKGAKVLIDAEGKHLGDIAERVPLKYTNVAIASRFGFHCDVYMPVAWTMKRLKDPLHVSVYAELPFHHDFQRIIDDYELYNGNYKHHSELLRDIASNTGEGAIDMIILGTCEIDMKSWGDELLTAWDARDSDCKFQLVCIVHNAEDNTWQKKIPDWSRRNAIRILPISPHVKETFHEMFMDRARESNSDIRSAGMEHIPVDAHVPILDVADLPVLSPSRRLSNAVIQGSFAANRRDYSRIFSELNHSLYADPYAWGYLPLGEASASFIPDTTDNLNPPFKLHLVGSGWIDVPTELKNLVVFHTELSYSDFYKIMANMDVCVPAFLATKDQNYRRQASSSISMCMEVNVPILALRQLREAYTYIDDDRITITRPAVMSEVEALKALRTGDSSAFLASGPSGSGMAMGANARVWNPIESMMRAGWVRTREGFDARKRQVWAENDKVIARILRGL